MSELSEQLKDKIADSVAQIISRNDVAADPSAARPIINAVTNAVVPSVLHATNAEPWYQSRVTWGAILAGAAAVLGIFGKADLLPAEMQGKIIDGVVAAGPLIGVGVVLYGRFIAKKPLGS